MGSMSFTHVLLLLIIILIFFGPSKLPQLGQSLGKAIRGFKEGLNEIDGEARELPRDNQQIRHQNQAASEIKQPEHSENKKS
jgi:sec-independent protein translocase protein TatA